MKQFFLLLSILTLSATTAFAQVTDIVSGLQFPYDCALYGDDLYITELGAGRVIKVDITAPVPPAIEVVLTGLANPAAMTISGDFLYYAESGADRVSKLDLTQMSPMPEVVVSTGLSTPNDLIVDGNFLYITDEGNDRFLRADLTVENPTPEIVASGLNNPLGIAKFGDDFYLSIFSSSSIVKVDVSQTPAVVTTVATGFTQPAGITLDGSFLYVAESGRVSRLDLNATTPTAEAVVTEGITGSRNVTFDGTDMYIAQTGGTFGGTGLISKLTIGTPVFSNLPNVCSDDMPTMLGGASPSSGIYSGPGVTDNGDGSTFSFDPTTAGGVGMYNVTYTLGSGAMVSTTLTVVQSPTVTFSTGGLSVQVDAGVQTGLSGGMPAGGVYSGNGVTDDGNGMTYSFDPAAAGEGENVITYTFADANGCGGEQGAIITVTPITLPGERCDIAIDINNLFGQAAMVPQASENYDNYMDYDTDDTDIIPSCFVTLLNGTGTIYFSFTGDGNLYRINSANNSSSNALAGIIYTGSCDMRTEVICGVAPGVPNFSVELQTEAGVEYTVMVAEESANQTASFNLEVTNLTDPTVPGDLCEGSIDISSLFGGAFNEPQVSNLYDNTVFVNGSDDPAAGFECFYGGDGLQKSGWFSFTGDGNTYRIRNVQCTGPNDNLDLQAVVYSGDCGSLVAGACNDDDPAGGTLTFLVEFEAEEGVEYVVLVDGYDGTTGEFCLEVTNLTDPTLPGEMCDIAIDINGLFGQAEMVPQSSDTYDNYADYDTDDTDMVPSCLFSLMPGTGTIWFSFTGDGNRYTINSANNSNPGNPLVGVAYSGTCDMRTELACEYMSGVTNFSIDLQTEAGVEYLIMVAEDFANETASFNLEITNQGTVGVQDIRNTAFNVYPNPTNGWVQLDGFMADRIEVVDQLGRTVRTQGQATNGVDLSGLPAGVYVLRMQAGTEVYSAKVVKE